MFALFRRLLFLLPAETAHHVGFAALRLLMAVPLLGPGLRRWLVADSEALRVSLWGRDFPSPLGLAAGFDKDASGYDALLGLGFGFVEVGTVTGEAQPGNPRPRLFRLPLDRAVVNRMGFNNRGAAAMAERLARGHRGVVGANIGKTKRLSEEEATADYEKSARLVAPHADYLVVNVSSPNTPGLRNLQAVEQLEPLLVAVRAAIETATTRPVPLLVKIAPDLSDQDVDAVAELALRLKLDGIVATNTTIERSGLRSPAAVVEGLGAGGLSGAPLKRRALEVLRRLRSRVGERVPLIAVGGVETADDVWERLEAGASLVQLYTGFIYGGPLLPWRINRAIEHRLAERGLASVRDIGRAAP